MLRYFLQLTSDVDVKDKAANKDATTGFDGCISFKGLNSVSLKKLFINKALK